MSDKIILAGTERMLQPIISNILAINQLIRSKDIGNIYGLPVQQYQEQVKFKPQVHLYFQQQVGAIDSELGAVTAQLSFRILNETAETYTPAKALALAGKINLSFGGGSPFSWQKGKHLYSYHAPHQGIQSRIYSINESEAKRVVREILGLQALTFDNNYFKDATKTADLATPADGNMGNDLVYGDSRKAPRRLPQVTVQFSHAEMLLHGLPQAICLVDMTGRKPEALIKGYLPQGVQ